MVCGAEYRVCRTHGSLVAGGFALTKWSDKNLLFSQLKTYVLRILSTKPTSILKGYVSGTHSMWF